MAASTATVSSIKRYGLTEVFRPTDGVDVDIIFVHGLDGHPYRTWTSDEGHIFWPADLLPAAVAEDKARVLVYGYDADLASTADGLSKDKIHNHAEQLVAVLSASRRQAGATERPIIFVAHSFGGIIVKRAMIYSSEIHGHHVSHLRSIFLSTFGILFLGTPHMGSDVAKWRSWLDTMYNAHCLSPLVEDESYLIHALTTGSETLQIIERDFVQLASRFHIYYFHEGKPTDLGGTLLYIVDEISASPVLSDVERATIQQDHAHMCEFANRSSPGFDLVTEGIQRYASQAPSIIRSRWEYEKSEQHSRKELAASELLDDTARGIQHINLKDSHDRATIQPDGSHNTSLESTRLSGLQQKSFYIVSRERVKDFLGREDQLQEIATFFSKKSSQQPKVLILHALGGQGKSQIALEYCQRSRNQYRGIFWINASSDALAIESYTQIAKAVADFNSASVQDGERVVRLVKDRLEAWAEKCLLVFDNYDQPEEFPQVQKFLPKIESCHVLFTSRHGDLGRLGSLVRIPGMGPEEGVALLLRGHDKRDIETNFATALEIVERLGYLALAIDQAAAYIRYRRILPHQLERFLNTYETQRERILNYTPSDFWEYSTVQKHGEEDQAKAINAFTTWEMSLEQLKSPPSMPNLEVLRLLTVSSYFNTARIEESLFRNYWEKCEDQAQWLRALGTKDDTAKDQLDHGQKNEYGGGVNARSDPSSKANEVAEIRLQRQVKGFLRMFKKKHAKSMCVSHSHQSQDGNDHPPLTKQGSGEWDPNRFWDILHTLHISSLVQDLEPGAQGAAFSLHPLIRDWLQLREPADARRRHMKESFLILSYRVKVPLDVHNPAWRIQPRIFLAHIDACISNDERLAAPHAKFGSEITDFNTAMNLAVFYLFSARYVASEEILRKVKETCAANLGEQHPYLPECLFYLGRSLQFQRRYREAEQVVRRALQLRARALGEEHPKTLQCMKSLGFTLEKQRKFSEAECIYREWLQLQEKVTGKDHQDTIPPMLCLAGLLSPQGRHDEAEELSRHAVQVCEETLEEPHSQTENAIESLAYVFANQAKYDEAEARYLQCVSLCEDRYGTEHPRLEYVLQRFGIMYYNQGKLDDADTMFRRALKLQLNSIGEEHPRAQDSISYLSLITYAQDNYAEAQLLLYRLLEIWQKSPGKGYLSSLAIMTKLAQVLRKQDKHAEADKMDRERLGLEKAEHEADWEEDSVCVSDLSEAPSAQ
ncbi:MAG: hypothetical protein Q9184_005482 [Pyrenodesmia sp. 2 TL-2023]